MEEQENERPVWRRIEFAGVTAVLVTLLFVVIGQSAEQLAFNMGGEETPVVSAKSKFSAIDFATTGSVARPPVVIGPCATRLP